MSGKRSIQYYPNWARYGRNYLPHNVPFQYVKDLAYAFYKIVPSGSGYVVQSGDTWADEQNLTQFTQLKTQHAFNLHVAIGGWTWSGLFSLAVRTAATRTQFAQSIKALLARWPVFNGVILDWEYPSNNGVNYGLEGNAVHPSDVTNLKLFLVELRGLLGAAVPLSICAHAAPEKIHLGNLAELAALLDEIHVMTYDFHSGAWGETICAHHCNPLPHPSWRYSAKESIEFFLAQGVPKSKLFIGAAFYSRGFANATALGLPAAGNSPDYQFPEEPGVVPYHMLPRPGATEAVDPVCKGAYSYDPTRRVINTYDNVESIITKGRLIYEYDIAGIICWEAAGDVRNPEDPRSLSRTLYQRVTHGRPDGTVPTPTPTPPPPTPPPTGTLPCDFCTICRKGATAGPCQARPPAPPPPPPPTPTPTPTPTTEWALNRTYVVGQRVTYQGRTYECLQAHTSYSPSWNPAEAPSLWRLVA